MHMLTHFITIKHQSKSKKQIELQCHFEKCKIYHPTYISKIKIHCLPFRNVDQETNKIRLNLHSIGLKPAATYKENRKASVKIFT